MSGIQYPRFHRDEKKSTKLKVKDVEMIKLLYQTGSIETINELAAIYGVCWHAIKCVLDESYRLKMQTKTAIYRKTQMEYDQEFKNHIYRLSTEGARDRRTRNPKIKTYQLALHSIRKKDPVIRKNGSIYLIHYNANRKEKAYQWNKNHFIVNRKQIYLNVNRWRRAKTFSGFRDFWHRVEK